MGVRSQIDYHLFITRLLKEEHKQAGAGASALDLVLLKQSGVYDLIDLKLRMRKYPL